jgi:hypothetical protein
VLRVAGLTLVERSSGLLKGQKRISKRVRPVFRRHAYIFAVRSVQKDGIFRSEYEALSAPAMAVARSRRSRPSMF